MLRDVSGHVAVRTLHRLESLLKDSRTGRFNSRPTAAKPSVVLGHTQTWLSGYHATGDRSSKQGPQAGLGDEANSQKSICKGWMGSCWADVDNLVSEAAWSWLQSKNKGAFEPSGFWLGVGTNLKFWVGPLDSTPLICCLPAPNVIRLISHTAGLALLHASNLDTH